MSERTADRPWPPTGLTSARWLLRPVARFAIEDLTTTQPGVLFEALKGQAVPYGGDEYPHVVIYAGVNYIEDGHHRYMRALIDRQDHLVCRWVQA